MTSSACGQVVGVGRLVLDVVAGVRVLEAQPDGVQPLPLEADPAGEHRVGAVGQVADARVLSAAMCTRIWWVRPVSRWISSRLANRCASSVS